MKDGVRYGVVEGTFRGRWWSYYERGRSFQDGGFLAEAEADFRHALEHRAADGRWARTYGLHFLPEYFPNRELGVTRYLQGDAAGAIPLLEASLAQTRSARASYYLDEARAASVRSGNLDAAPPSVEMIGAAAAAPVAAFEAEVRVIARDDTFVRSVRIAGEEALHTGSAPAAEVSRVVRVGPGANAVPVVVTDIAGRTLETRLPVAVDVDGPVIAFAPPEDGTLRGSVYDAAGVASLRVGEAEAALTAEGSGWYAFALAAEPGTHFEAVDGLGNVTRGRLHAGGAGRPAAQGPGGAQAAVDLHGPWRRAAGLSAAVRSAALAQALADGAGPAIAFLNIEPGQRYLKDEIVVSVEVSGESPLESLEIDGARVGSLVQGPLRQIASRRVRLDAPGEHVVTVRAQDTAGRSAEAQATVVRDLTAVEQIDSRLSVALLGSVWEGTAPADADERAFVADALGRRLYRGGRFDLISREALPRVLDEQELAAALGARGGPSPLESVVAAELFAIARVRRGAESLEIVLQGIDAATSQVLAYVDVAGPAQDAAQAEALIGDLAALFEQAFPRMQGAVVDVSNPARCVSTLTAADGVRKAMRCLVFRRGPEIVHPRTGEPLGHTADILAEGRLDEVQARLSRIQLFDAPAGAAAVAIDDLVLTK